jgi:hypothetical protein
VNTGVIFLAAMTLVAVTDSFMAIRFRQMADRADDGVPELHGKVDPEGMRRVATFMLIFAPILFAGAVLISFGVIPVGGIHQIKF